MLVKLLKEIRENIKQNSLGVVTDPGVLKESVRGGRRFPFVAGAVLDMSEASARKYIAAGVAEPHAGPPDVGIAILPSSAELRAHAARAVEAADKLDKQAGARA